MATNNFNDLLLHLLKEIGIRLERLEGRTDRMIDQKANKTDVEVVIAKLDQKADKADLEAIAKKLDQKAAQFDLDATNQKLDTLITQMTDFGGRLDRIEGGIGTLKWIVGAEVAVIGVILAFIRAC